MQEPGRTRPGQFTRLKTLAVVALAAAIGLFFVNRLDPLIFTWRIKTTPARFGTAETTTRVRGVLLWPEELVRSPAHGRVTLLVGEGRRVRAGDVVMEVGPVSDPVVISARLAEIDAELRQLEASARRTSSELAAAVERLQRELADAERRLNEALSAGRDAEARDALAKRDQLRAELAEANRRQDEAALANQARRQALEAARSALLNPPATGATLVRAPSSGLVSFALDGLEERLRPGAGIADSLEAGTGAAVRVHDGMVVAPGDPLFRLIDVSGVTEVVVSARVDRAPSSGARVEVVFDHIPEIHFQGEVIEAIRAGRDWRARVRLSVTDQSLIHRRTVSATIVSDRAQGIVVPASAVVDDGEKKGLYVMLGDRPIFREVVVLGGNEAYLVVRGPQGVPEGALVVTNPQVVRERR